MEADLLDDDFDIEFSDIEDDELEQLHESTVNKVVHESVVTRQLPLQRDLTNKVLLDQQHVYEEIKREVTFGPTHHELNHEALSTYIYPINYELRQYQFDIVSKALLSNTLCAIPTGTGKTFIASTVMLNFFRWTRTAKIIFVAPTRPLVAQQIKACLGITGIPSTETAILLDKTRKNREEIWAAKRVFFATPQVVENDLKRGALSPKDIVCLIIDEAHRATGSYAYSNVVQFIRRFNTSFRVLALTATPGTDLENVQEVVRNLDISKIELRTEESMDISRYMKRREKQKIQVGLTLEIGDIIEQIGIAINPILQQAIELGIFDPCEPSQINSFKAMQASQKIIMNSSIPEGIKWRNFFILQLLNHVGQMLKRIKIYGVRTFFSYFMNKYKEFTSKYNLGKSTNKLAASFYYNPIIQNIIKDCEKYVIDPKFSGHAKLDHLSQELVEFFEETGDQSSRAIVFTELRESALEIVKHIDSLENHYMKPHIFIGQARGKEGFDEVEYTKKHKKVGRKKVDRVNFREEMKLVEEKKRQEIEELKLQRAARRTASSEEAQISGMNQKQQKQVIHDFRKGIHNVLVCTSIGEEGLDIGEVDLIICYDTTSSPIKNIQRMGRTGRKRDGRIVLLFSSNEARKFEQAMEDYANLQKLIAGQHLVYEKSDRILPPDITLECIKEYITVDEQNKEVSNMDDTEEIIKYATQCMLGKPPKGKRKKADSKELKKKKQKPFFLPDNAQISIVRASDMVNKYRIQSNGQKEIIESIDHKESEQAHPRAQTCILDDLERDSLESDVDLDPNNIELLVELNEPSELKVKQKTDSPNNNETSDIVDITKAKAPIKQLKEEADIPNLSDILLDPNEYGQSDSDDVPLTKHVKPDKVIPLPKHSPDLRPLVHLHQKEMKENNTTKAYIKRENSMDHFRPLSPPISEGQPYPSMIYLRTLKGTNLVDPNFDVTAGFLSSSQKQLFKKRYNPTATVSIEPVPRFHLTMASKLVPHSAKVQNLLNIFHNSDVGYKISMNRIRCIAKNMEHASCSVDQSSFENAKNESSTANTSDISEMVSHSTQKELDDLLESDSDF